MKKLNYSLCTLLFVGLMFSCGGDDEPVDKDVSNGTIEEVVENPCPDENALSVNFNAKSQGIDTSLYQNDGAFEVVQTSIVHFHDSTMVLKIDNYDGARESAEDIELYISLYTRKGEVLGEGEYGLDMQNSKSTNLLIYVGEGMLVCPVHLSEGSVIVSSYSKEKVCGSIDIKVNDTNGKYGEVNVSGDFIVE